MKDWILLGVLLLVVALASCYVIKAKKSGQKCIGCPNGCRCGSAGEPPCHCGKN